VSRFLRIASILMLALLVPHAKSEAQSARAFSIYLDCQDFYCESDFYRSELSFVDHVRDRTAADVHVLVTSQSTGGGGRSFSLAFYGQHRFAGISDTLTANTAQGATEAEQRQVIARTVRLGLVRYLARTREGERVAVTLGAPKAASDTATKAAHDPWNAWVFRIGANMNGNSETQYQSAYINGNLRASRITEAWKTTLQVYEDYSDQKFDVDGEKITTVRRDFGGSALQVRSINDHWSLGGRAGASSSTYLNQRLAATIAPAIEYDLYPYKESTRRQLIAQYSVGMRHFAYNDTTVYFKIKETRPFESLSIGLSQKQQWGSINFGANGYHFLDDFGKSRLSFNLETDVRIIKGLSISSYIDYAVIHDQLYLPKGNLTKDEVLLRQSQLQTGYRAFFYISANYTFGSVLNNVVNPRFNTGGNDF
jgi:hypothetical protein